MASLAPSADPGQIFLQCRFGQRYAIFVVVLGGFFSWLMLELLILHAWLPEPRQPVIRNVYWGILALAALTTLLGLRQLFWPAKIVTAGSNGLVVYGPRDGASPGGLLIPWSRIRSIDYDRRKALMLGKRAYSETIELKLAVDDEWSVPPGFSHYKTDPPDELHIDAFSGRPRKKALLEGLKGVQLRCGG